MCTYDTQTCENQRLSHSGHPRLFVHMDRASFHLVNLDNNTDNPSLTHRHLIKTIKMILDNAGFLDTLEGALCSSSAGIKEGTPAGYVL